MTAGKAERGLGTRRVLRMGVRAFGTGFILVCLALLLPAGCGRDPELGVAATTAHVLRYERGGLLYTYHVLTETEALFDLDSDPRCLKNLSSDRWRDAVALRRRLEREIGVMSLHGLKNPDDPVLQRLRSLGYL